MKLDRWHPFAEKFPLLEGAEWEALKESIKATKGCADNPVRYRMVKGKKEGLDGRNREKACAELDIPCSYKLVNVKDKDVVAYIIRHNVTRRHLGVEFRRTLVAELRSDGQSTREIGQTLGVDPKTVRNDLASTGENSPVETVVGLDGKTRPAEKPPLLCDRCKRVGARPGCLNCLTARKEAEKAKKAKTRAKQAEPTELIDAFKNPIPRKCKDAWADPWIQKAFDFLTVFEEGFRKERLASGMHKRKKHYPFFNDKDFVDACGFVMDYLDKMVQHLKEQRPAGVCPSCQGKGCTDCRSSGLVPREVYKELTKKVKA